MIQLSQDFVHAAKTYGKIIISEVFMEKKVRVTISFLLSLSLSLFSPLLCSWSYALIRLSSLSWLAVEQGDKNTSKIIYSSNSPSTPQVLLYLCLSVFLSLSITLTPSRFPLLLTSLMDRPLPGKPTARSESMPPSSLRLSYFSHSHLSLPQAAGHDLKGATSIYNLNIPEISLPLIALVDYRYFEIDDSSKRRNLFLNTFVYSQRISFDRYQPSPSFTRKSCLRHQRQVRRISWWRLSISLSLPPTAAVYSLLSLLWHSGLTVFKENKEMNKIMRAVGIARNLRPHMCGVRVRAHLSLSLCLSLSLSLSLLHGNVLFFLFWSFFF